MSTYAARPVAKELGIPRAAWPFVGLAAGLALVMVIHAACFDRNG